MIVKKPTSAEIDATKSWGLWEKEPSIFPWSYSQKETCYILEGEAKVIAKDGKSVSFGKGDWVEFEQGLDCTWKISKTIRKRYKFG